MLISFGFLVGKKTDGRTDGRRQWWWDVVVVLES